jgi:hypothetical protein
VAEKEELTTEEFETLARQVGLPLRPGAAPEMARAYARLRVLAERVRAERDIGAEPAHLFKP